jgi:hypothetical protein
MTEDLLTNLLGALERPETMSELTVSSMLSTFLRALGGLTTAQALLEAATASDESRQRLVTQIDAWSSLQVDERYLHPKDIPLAVLLWVMKETDRELALLSADVVNRAPNLWWAQKVIDQLRYDLQVQSANCVSHTGASDVLGTLVLSVSEDSDLRLAFSPYSPRSESVVTTSSKGLSDQSKLSSADTFQATVRERVLTAA